jgi:hypothetical protein
VERRVAWARRLLPVRPWTRRVRHVGAIDLRARGSSPRGFALTLSPGVPAARYGPVPPRTGHDVIAPDAHTPTVPS